MPPLKGQAVGGILDPSQTTLTLNQRRTMQNLVAQGIAPAVARNLAIALTKSAAVRVQKKSYHQAFSEAAKEILPEGLTRRLHIRARAIAGGHASAAARVREAEVDKTIEAVKSLQTVCPDFVAMRNEEAAERDRVLHPRVVKSENSVPPKGVQAACKRGLKLAPEYGGGGLTEGAKARARSMAQGNAVSPSQLSRMASFFARHETDKRDGWSSPPTPGYVSWLLWGGDAGKAWANSKKEKVDKSSRGILLAKKAKALGAAFSHARATGKKQDHESRKRRANKWLKENGHEPIGKMAPQPQDVRADQFLRLVRDRKKKAKADAKVKKAERVAVTMPCRIVKAEQQEWQRLVWSVVYEPDTVDLHGDYMNADTIQKAAHDAMRAGIFINSEHAGDPLDAEVVESYTAPCDFKLNTADGDVTVTKGSWVQCLHIKDDAHWQGVLNGTYTGFSLEGMAVAQAV